MEEIGKIAAVAIVAAVCAVVVKKTTREIGMMLALTAAVLILILALGRVEQILELMDALRETAGLSPAVLAPVLKTVGIAILTRVSCEICKDAGEGGIAAALETAGAILALLVALPLMRAVLDTITGLL